MKFNHSYPALQNIH